MKRREQIIMKASKVPSKVSSKQKPEIKHAEDRPDFEEKCVERMNELYPDANFKTYQELPRYVIQIPIEFERDGMPIGKIINQAHYWIANEDYKKARTLLKSMGMSGLEAKLYVKSEMKLQKRNPEEKSKYFNKPLPEELKLISDLLN